MAVRTFLRTGTNLRRFRYSRRCSFLYQIHQISFIHKIQEVNIVFAVVCSVNDDIKVIPILGNHRHKLLVTVRSGLNIINQGKISIRREWWSLFFFLFLILFLFLFLFRFFLWCCIRTFVYRIRHLSKNWHRKGGHQYDNRHQGKKAS